jgi:hypothetical protein
MLWGKGALMAVLLPIANILHLWRHSRELTEQEARLEILKEGQLDNGNDSATDALIARVEKEIKLAEKLAMPQREFGGETEEDKDPEEDSSLGRDAWPERLPKVCEEFNREYRHNMKGHRTTARSMLKGEYFGK